MRALWMALPAMIVAVAPGSGSWASDAAHRMAEGFAAEQSKAAADSAKAAAEKSAKEAEQKRREAERKAAAAKAAAEKSAADAQRRSDEQDMLARARAEAEERRAAMKKAAEEALRAEAEAELAERQAREAAIAKAAADALAAAEARRLAEAERQRQLELAAAAEAEHKRQTELAAEAERQREVEAAEARNRIALESQERRRHDADVADARRAAAWSAMAQSEPLSTEPQQTAAAPVEPSAPERQTEQPPAPPTTEIAAVRPNDRTLPEPALGVAAPARPLDHRVTLLLAMEPGDRGIRRFEKTGDPVLCIGQRCYIGAGPDQDAREVTRWGALGTGNTLGKRAGACSHALTCIFRNVDLGGEQAVVQPIDLRILRHDRRAERTVAADPTCAIVGGRITCRNAVTAPDWRLWVVPEPVAREAGGAALQAALKEWLPEAMSAGR